MKPLYPIREAGLERLGTVVGKYMLMSMVTFLRVAYYGGTNTVPGGLYIIYNKGILNVHVDWS